MGAGLDVKLYKRKLHWTLSVKQTDEVYLLARFAHSERPPPHGLCSDHQRIPLDKLRRNLDCLSVHLPPHALKVICFARKRKAHLILTFNCYCEEFFPTWGHWKTTSVPMDILSSHPAHPNPKVTATLTPSSFQTRRATTTTYSNTKTRAIFSEEIRGENKPQELADQVWLLHRAISSYAGIWHSSFLPI